jgi:hypothetical protein
VREKGAQQELKRVEAEQRVDDIGKVQVDRPELERLT